MQSRLSSFSRWVLMPLLFMAFISCIRISPLPKNIQLNQDIDNALIHPNSLYHIGWLTSLYIGMTETEFLDYWDARAYSYKKELITKFRDSLDQQTNTRMYNGSPDPLFSNIIKTEKLKDVPSLKKRRTMEFYKKRDTLNHLPTFRRKDFIYYEITDREFPKVMKLFYQRNYTIDTAFVDDIIAKATFWFDKKDKKLFRVDISLRDESTKNIKNIIQLSTGELPTRNTVKFLDMFDKEFDSYVADNDRKFLLDDLYTTVRGESDDGILERRKSEAAEKYIRDTTRAFNQEQVLLNLINYHNQNKITAIDQKYCNDLHRGYYDSLFSEKPWIVKEIRNFLNETEACDEQNQFMKMTYELEELEKYYELNLRKRIDSISDRNSLIIKEYERFLKQYTLIPYRYRNYLEKTDSVDQSQTDLFINTDTVWSLSSTSQINKSKRRGNRRTKRFNDNYELIRDSKEIEDVNYLFRGGIYRRRVFWPHLLDLGKNSGKSKWLAYRSITDYVATEIQFTIDSLLKSNINYGLMEHYYESVIYNIKNKRYEELDEVYCPLLQYYPIKVVLDKKNSYSLFNEKNKPKNLVGIQANLDSIKKDFVDSRILSEGLQVKLSANINTNKVALNAFPNNLTNINQADFYRKLTFYKKEIDKNLNDALISTNDLQKLTINPVKKSDSIATSILTNLNSENANSVKSTLQQTSSALNQTSTLSKLLKSTVGISNGIAGKYEEIKKDVDSINSDAGKTAFYSQKILRQLANLQDTSQLIINQTRHAIDKINALLKTPEYSDSIPYFYEFYPKNFEESLEKSYYQVDSIFYVKVMKLFNESCLCSPNEYNCLEPNEGVIGQHIRNFKKYMSTIEKEHYNAKRKIAAIEIADKNKKDEIKNGIKAWSYSGLFGEEIQLFICSHPKSNPLKIHYEREFKNVKYPAISIYDRNKVTELLIHKID